MSRATPSSSAFTDHKRPGPAAKLSLERIVDAALPHDISTLTVPMLAAKLGVTHAALYRYVGNAHGLRMACVAEVTRRAVWPADEGRWDDRLRAFARGLWAACDRFQGLATLLTVTPGALTLAAEPLRAYMNGLLSAGLRPAVVETAMDLVADTVLITHTQFSVLRSAEGADAPPTALTGLWGTEDSVVLPHDTTGPYPGLIEDKIEIVIEGLRVRYDLP